MKSDLAPGEQGIFTKMLELGESTMLSSMSSKRKNVVITGKTLKSFCSYKLLTKIITDRLTNKFYSYQPQEYNIQIYLSLIGYSKAFDDIELGAVFQAIMNARIDSRYGNLLEYIYNKATLQVKITKDT